MGSRRNVAYYIRLDWHTVDIEMKALGDRDSNRFAVLYEKVAALINAARRQVQAQVNQTLVLTYWQLGQMIVEDEQAGESRAEYGKAVLENLSQQLTIDFGKGFDVTNLRHMRRFYLLFPIRDAVRPNLSWTHYRLLVKVENKAALYG
jgi:hypothetical protein